MRYLFPVTLYRDESASYLRLEVDAPGWGEFGGDDLEKVQAAFEKFWINHRARFFPGWRVQYSGWPKKYTWGSQGPSPPTYTRGREAQDLT